MTSGHPWHARGRQGQAAVEFALVLPVLLLLMVGVLEFARAWNLHQTLTDAVREGARRALLARDTDTGVTIQEEADSVWHLPKRLLEENSG